MASEVKIGVVTVTYNGAAYLKPFFRDCFRQTFSNFILYVIDNDSQDGALKIAQSQEDPRCRVISNGKNLGVAEGNNIGIRAAMNDGCTDILLLNNDTEFPDSLFEILLNESRDIPAMMIVPKMYFFDSPTKIWCAGGDFVPSKGWSFASRGEGEIDDGKYDSRSQISCAPTCCMLINVDVFGQVGLMDEKYFVYFDDTDFCLRAHRFGIKMYYTPRTYLLHKVSQSTGGYSKSGNSSFQIKMYSRNKIYYILKNIGWKGWISILCYFAKIILQALIPSTGGAVGSIGRIKSSINGFLLYLGYREL